MRYIVDGFLALVTLVTIGWVAIRALKDSDHRSGLVARWIVTAALIAGACHFAVKLWNGGLNVAWIIPFVIMVAGLVLSILWTPALSEWAVKPLTGILDGGNEPQEARPLYSAAIAKRQRGNFVEAVVAIREQLAKFPNDLEGVMLLARIQAEDLKDLPSAEMTFNHFCANPKVPPRQFQNTASAGFQADTNLKTIFSLVPGKMVSVALSSSAILVARRSEPALLR
jgi:hypothetical protein